MDKDLHDWDEKYHALVAKNLTKDWSVPKLYDQPILEYDYKSWVGNHVWLHKPPLSLYGIALVYKIFGPSVFATRLLSILLSSLCIYFVYRIAFILFNERIANWSSFLFAINGFILDLVSGRTATDHVDTMLLFWICAYIMLLLKWKDNMSYLRILVLSMVLAFGVLTKWLVMSIVIIFFGIIIFGSSNTFTKKLNYSLLHIIGASIIVLPWYLYSYLYFRQEFLYEMKMNSEHLFRVIEGHGHSMDFYIHKMRILFGEWIYIPLSLLLFLLYKEPKNKQYWIIAIWIFLPLIIFTSAQTKMQSYIGISAPAYFICTSVFIEFCKNNIQANWMYKLIVVVIGSLAVRYCIERLKPLQFLYPHKTEYVQKGYDEHTIVFGDPEPIKTMFFEPVIASYSHIPEQVILDSIESLNRYQIVIIDPLKQ